MAKTTAAKNLQGYEREQEFVREQDWQPEQPKPRLTVRSSSAPRVSGLRIAACVVLVLALVVSSIQSNVYKTELGDSLVMYQRQLSALRQEQARLQSRLDHEVPMLNLKEYAADTLGMSKVREYQTTYLNLDCGNAIIRTEKCPDRDILRRCLKKAGELVEYLKVR